MKPRRQPCLLVASMLVGLALPAHAAHRYYDDSRGLFVWVEAGLTRIGNADRTVGLSQTAGPPESSRPLTVDWNEGDVAAAGLGYRWGANTLALRYWSFDDDRSLVADGPSGGRIVPSVGAPAPLDGNPGYLDVEASIEAELLDVTWTHVNEIGELFDLSWSVGLRYAAFEETLRGRFDLCARGGCEAPAGPAVGFGDVRFDTHEDRDAGMAGLLVAVGGTYHFADSLAVASRVGLSALTGEIQTTAGRVPSGATNLTDPAALFEAEDDDRNGEIVDLEVAFHWFLAGDRVRLSLGYSATRWDGIADSLLPGVVGGHRDEPGFNTVSLGVRYEF